MPLHPNLHLLLPLSDPSVQLEARLYLPHDPPSSSTSSPSSAHTLPLTTSASSEPISAAGLSLSIQDALAAWEVERFITVAHPWGKMGANMLVCVIVDYLPSAIAKQNKRTAVLSFNARGIGRSTGSAAWGFLSSPDSDDYAEIEAWGLGVLGPKEVCRMGNSMGTIAALHAPLPETHRMESILLVSPPVTIFWVLSFLRPPKGFHAGLKAILDASPETDSANGQSSQRRIPICIIYGNQDPFTRAGSYRALGRKYAQKGLMMTEIDGAGHFHHSEKEGEGVKRAIGEWLDSL